MHIWFVVTSAIPMTTTHHTLQLLVQRDSPLLYGHRRTCYSSLSTRSHCLIRTCAPGGMQSRPAESMHGQARHHAVRQPALPCPPTNMHAPQATRSHCLMRTRAPDGIQPCSPSESMSTYNSFLWLANTTPCAPVINVPLSWPPTRSLMHVGVRMSTQLHCRHTFDTAT
jgi:hypothetical protein